MKLWLDDVRAPPDDSWTWAVSAKQAIDIMLAQWPSHVSLDHDLGDYEVDGNVVAIWITAAILARARPPLTWACHSMNPVGKARIERTFILADASVRKGGDNGD